MQVHVLYSTDGEILAVFHPSVTPDGPQLTFAPTRKQRTAVMEVPAEFERLAPADLHSALAVKVKKSGPMLVARKR